MPLAEVPATYRNGRRARRASSGPSATAPDPSGRSPSCSRRTAAAVLTWAFVVLASTSLALAWPVVAEFLRTGLVPASPPPSCRPASCCSPSTACSAAGARHGDARPAGDEAHGVSRHTSPEPRRCRSRRIETRRCRRLLTPSFAGSSPASRWWAWPLRRRLRRALSVPARHQARPVRRRLVPISPPPAHLVPEPPDHLRRRSPPGRQWARFIATNALGALVNYGSYSAVVTLLPAGTWVPLLGVAVGALAGLGFNFTASRRFVFKADPPNRRRRPGARSASRGRAPLADAGGTRQRRQRGRASPAPAASRRVRRGSLR